MLVVQPNKQSLICSPCFNSGDVGREIVKSAKDLVLKLKQGQENTGQFEEKIRSIQVKQESMEVKIDDIISKLESLCKQIGNKI